jgi:hypothetical protein
MTGLDLRFCPAVSRSERLLARFLSFNAIYPSPRPRHRIRGGAVRHISSTFRGAEAVGAVHQLGETRCYTSPYSYFVLSSTIPISAADRSNSS